MTAPAAGLSSAEAAARLARRGPNDIAGPRRFRGVREAVRCLASPLVLILLAAAGVSAALGDPRSAGVIAVIVGMSAVLNFSQAHRSTRAAEALASRAGHAATVVRDGALREVPAREVVAGDVLHLAAGDLVAADGTVVAARDLFLDEAPLTGESLPVEKHAEAPVYRGTSVVSGVATVIVTRTGRATEFGRVAERLAGSVPETEFERGIRRFGAMIFQVILALVLFVFIVNALQRRDLLQSALFALALAVGLTPELLPMIVSVALATGAAHMARRKVIVRRLPSIENFGSMDILCADKTGTLTAGRISVERHVDVGGREDEAVIALAAVNSAYQTGLKSPMDEAILRHEHPAVERYTPLDEVPFDFSRRRVSVVVRDGGECLLITKGAPESVLAICSTVVVAGAEKPLDSTLRAEAERLFAALSTDGFRVLAVASRPVPARATYSVADERGLTLAGFAAFLDPPRPDVGATLAALRDDGVDVKIITGDNDLVAARVCREVGLAVDRIVLGAEVDRLSDGALGAVAERTQVFARVSPEQKTRIVVALRGRGHVVGCLGDGINDAPALRAADVGISVDTAVEVAREAADIILLEKRLAVLHDGVVEGRRSFGNVMKYVLMSASSNFGNMLSVATASLFLPFLPMLPLQILINNFLYDVSQLAIPTDRVDRAWLVKPRRWRVDLIRRSMLVLGPVSSFFDLLTFGVMLGVFHAGPVLFRTGWFVESLATQTLVILVIRTTGRPWASRPGRGLLLGVAGALGAGLLLPFTPAAGALGFTPLPPLFFAVMMGMTLMYLLLVEAVKSRLYRHYGL